MKKLWILICSMFFLCFFISAPSAHAQFWKKKKKKEKTVQPATHTEKEVPSEEKNQGQKRNEPSYPKSEQKERYRIDVLIPLNIANLVEDGKALYKSPPLSMKNNIHFYEGIKMASDSLNNLGYKLDLYIHDVSDVESNGMNLVKNPAFKNSDLIIGYLQSAEIPPVANFAKKNQINFISALSPSDAGISDNPYFILIQPKLSTHIEHLVAFGRKKFKNLPQYIYFSKENTVQEESYNQLKSALNNDKIIEIDWTKNISNDSLKLIFDSTRMNIVYVNVLSTAEAEIILKKLAKLPQAYKFSILGMPSWKSISRMGSANEFGNLHIYFTNPFYFDEHSGAGKKLNQMYKEKHGETISELTFRGFETLFWTAQLLEKYGTIFNKNINNPQFTSFTEYKIESSWSPKSEFQYLENKNIYIYHYYNGYFNIE